MSIVKRFTASDFDFQEIARIYNMVSHDDSDHPDDIKESWELRDKTLTRDRLFIYHNEKAVGYLGYAQGRDENKRNCFFSIFIDPKYSGLGFRKLLMDYMLEDVKQFRCNCLYSSIFEHPNYQENQKFLIDNGFIECFKVREYSLMLENAKIDQYIPLYEKLNNQGIYLYEPKVDLNRSKEHYKKIEELEWIYGQDFPMPKGIKNTRTPYKQWLKEQKIYEEKYYGVEIIALDGNNYIGSTDISVYSKSDPYKAWTGGLGVLKQYRRRGIATAMKIKVIEKLREKGIKELRTDNWENNPMYKINEFLGFKPVPFSVEYMKKI